MKNIIKIRAILSSLLIIIFTIVAITGIGLYIAPSGRIAKETTWYFLGLNKWQLEKLHALSGFILVGLIIIHFLINRKMFSTEIKALVKK